MKNFCGACYAENNNLKMNVELKHKCMYDYKFRPSVDPFLSKLVTEINLDSEWALQLLESKLNILHNTIDFRLQTNYHIFKNNVSKNKSTKYETL